MSCETPGDWFVTASGRRVFVLRPRCGDIRPEDIAASLSKLCRFGGHCRPFYSVAQHSVHVSLLVPPDLAVLGLLHDAAEAYLQDIIRPVKRELPDYRALERIWEPVIHERFGLCPSAADLVALKAADTKALVTERRDVGHRSWTNWHWKEEEQGARPDSARLVPLGPDRAERYFLSRAAQLGVV